MKREEEKRQGRRGRKEEERRTSYDPRMQNFLLTKMICICPTSTSLSFLARVAKAARRVG